MNRKRVSATMDYLVIYEQGERSIGAYVPDLPGCVAFAETEAEVRTLIREAVALHVEDMRKTGQPVPSPTSRADLVRVA